MADDETTYGFRHIERKKGRNLAGGDEIASAYSLGEAMAQSILELLQRGYALDQVESKAIAVEGGKPRDLTDKEFAAAEAALLQVTSSVKKPD
jgi:hypothetical protein